MNNAAIVPATSHALTLVPAPSAPPPPPERTLRGRPFAAVYQDVQQRAEEMLPDQIVHVADLKMTPEGQIELPGGVHYRMNDHARRQLSTLLGSLHSECHQVRAQSLFGRPDASDPSVLRPESPG